MKDIRREDDTFGEAALVAGVMHYEELNPAYMAKVLSGHSVAALVVVLDTRGGEAAALTAAATFK